ncbi:MAG: UbiD family decarboxylase [Armatimonadota bacterium]|nr:UbiD family decarboxylase [Armatimonadota bacterium]
MAVTVPKTAGSLDARDWLRQVEALGELRVVRGASWDLEIGVITEEVQKRRNPPGPAVLFDEVPGYPAGYRVLVNTLGSPRRLALTLGLPTDASDRELVSLWRKRSREIQPIPPVEVPDGPVLENVLEGDAVDLLRFPVPRWHERDGGRYIGTGSVNITRDPDDGTLNAGTYRVMVRDAKSAFFYVSPGKHGRIHRDKYFSRGEPCPVVVCAGHHPLVFLAGSLELPYGLNELAWVGGVVGEPVKVVRGRYTGLPFPAEAEIAFEGFAYPDRFEPEGPFGEWTGYYASSARPEPWIEVKAVYHRNDPILLGSPPGKPPTELTYYRAVLRSALIEEALEKAGVPDVTGVWCHEAGGSRLLVVVGVRQRYAGHAKQAALAALSSHPGNYLGRYVVVVDEDVDVTDLQEVMWAVCTRSDPEESIDIVRRCWSGPLDPRIPPDRKGFNSRAVIDATRPFEWKDRFPAVACSSPEVRERVLAKWAEVLR